jgi:hypothetical protein
MVGLQPHYSLKKKLDGEAQIETTFVRTDRGWGRLCYVEGAISCLAEYVMVMTDNRQSTLKGLVGMKK